MARTRAFNEGRALRALAAVFWDKGYEAATYDELMAAAGLGKGSLYAAFGDKRALYRRALEAYIGEEMAALAAILGREGASPRDRIADVFDYAIDARDRGDRRGCFLCNAAVDRAAQDDAIGALVKAAFDAAQDAFDAAAGPVSGGHYFAVFLGLRVMARAGATADAMRRARDAALGGFGPGTLN